MKTNWLEHLKIVTDILDVFWEARLKHKIETEIKEPIRAMDVVALVNSKTLSQKEAREILRSLGIKLTEE